LSFAACGYFASSINVESNVLKFFAEDSTLRRDYSFVADNLTGLYTVELDIESDALDEDDVSEALESLGKLIAARPDVARVDYLDRYTQATALSSTDDISQGTKDFFEFVQSKFRYEGEQSVWLRASVYVRTIGSGKFYSLLEFIKEKAEATLPEETTFKITGVVPLLNAVQKDLVTTQITSFSLALIVVLIMIGVFTASLKAAVAAVLPNVLPVALMFAFMGVLGVPLDAATVMIASVAIGIAADDTIHFLIHFRREMLNKCDSNKAVADTLSSVGKPVLLTSIVAAVGFGILVLAEFQPIVYFGLLTSITMLSAFFGDVFILPACVKMVGLWKTN
jgi:predicted RND superfamily exporter protein